MLSFIYLVFYLKCVVTVLLHNFPVAQIFEASCEDKDLNCIEIITQKLHI